MNAIAADVIAIIMRNPSVPTPNFSNNFLYVFTPENCKNGITIAIIVKKDEIVLKIKTCLTICLLRRS